MSPITGIRVSPVPVSLPGVRWLVVLVPVLVRIPVVVLLVFRSVGVITRVGTSVTSVIHDDPFTRSVHLKT